MARSVSTWKQQGKRVFAALVLAGTVVHLALWLYRRGGRWSGNFGKGKFRLQTFLGQPPSDEYAREHARWQHEKDLRGLAELRSQRDTSASAEHPTKPLTKRQLHRIAATTGRRVSCVSHRRVFCVSLVALRHSSCLIAYTSSVRLRRKLCHILGEGQRRAHREQRI